MNFLETILGQLGGSTVDKIGSLLGEQNTGTKSAIGAVVPFLLSTIAKKATGSTSGADSIFGMMKDEDDGLLDNFGNLLGSTSGRDNITTRGGGLLSSLLGSQLGNIVSAVSGFSGLRSGSASSLLKIVAPMIMSSLFKAKRSGGLNASSLANLLKGQAGEFEKAIPSGFTNSLKSFGIGDISKTVSSTAGNVVSGAGRLASNATTSVGNTAGKVASTANVAVEETGGFLRKILPWLLIGLLGLLLFGLYKGCSGDKTVHNSKIEKVRNTKVNKNQVNKAKGKVTNNAKSKIPARPRIDLSKLGISVSSAEGKFANMLNAGKARVGSNFILNKVEFDSGSANIKANSYGQLNSLIKIMSAYPRLKIRLEGHTDSSGNANRNLTLSKQRAEAVKRYLSTKGVKANRLSSNGFGITKPIADNKTRDGRAKNRRVEAIVTGM